MKANSKLLNEYVKLIVEAPKKETNKQLLSRYGDTFGLIFRGGLGGQWLLYDNDDNIAASFESYGGAFAKGPVFRIRLWREDEWSGRLEDEYVIPSDESVGSFTRADVEQAIASGTPLHDTQPDRRTKRPRTKRGRS